MYRPISNNFHMAIFLVVFELNNCIIDKEHKVHFTEKSIPPLRFLATYMGLMCTLRKCPQFFIIKELCSVYELSQWWRCQVSSHPHVFCGNTVTSHNQIVAYNVVLT